MKIALLLIFTVLIFCSTTMSANSSDDKGYHPSLAYLKSGYTVYGLNTGVIYYIKKSSIKSSGDKMIGWYFWELEKPTNGSVGLRFKMEADCNGETLERVEAEYFDTNGKSIKLDANRLRVQYKEGSMIEATFQDLCGKKRAAR